MDDSQDSGLDRVRSVLEMRVEDAGDLLRFGTAIANFTADELILLAGNLPTHPRIGDKPTPSRNVRLEPRHKPVMT